MANVTTVWFPQISSINGYIYIASLPALTNLSDFELVPYGPSSSTAVLITGTSITSLALSSNPFDGKNGTFLPYGEIRITDNPNLANLSLAFGAVTGSFNVSAQNISSDIVSIGGSFELFGCSRFYSSTFSCLSPNCTLVSVLPVGEVTGDIYVHDTQLTAIEIPQSAKALGLDISNNLLLTSLSSVVCPGQCFVLMGNATASNNNLTSLSGGILIQNNPLLANVLLPSLQTIGGAFTAKNNTLLKVLDGFPSLQTISGSVDLQGDFSEVEFPQLEKGFNGFTLISSNSSLNCSSLDNYYQTQVIRGAYNCTGLYGTSSTSTNTTSPAPRSGSSKLSTGAKAGIGIGVGIAVIALLALGVWLILKKFKVVKRTEGVGMGTDDKKQELPQGRHHEKTELEAREDPGEMDGSTVSWVAGSGEERATTIPRKPVPERHGVL